jgi:hypothetical protein
LYHKAFAAIEEDYGSLELGSCHERRRTGAVGAGAGLGRDARSSHFARPLKSTLELGPGFGKKLTGKSIP